MKAPRYLFILFVLIIASCSNQNGRSEYTADASSEERSASTDSTSVSAAGAPLSLQSPDRKIIKTAALRCRVTDVFAATSRIERLTTQYGGQIAESRMDNEFTGSQLLPYSTDSLKQTQAYTTTANLTLKVPVQQLDTVVAFIAQQASFINNRRLNLEDVTLQHLANQLKLQAAQQNKRADDAGRLAKRSTDAIAAGKYEQETQLNTIEQRMANRSIEDEVAYATLTLELYQPARVDVVMIANTAHLMKASFGTRITSALKQSWFFLQDCLILLIEGWPVLALIFIGWYAYRRVKAGRKILFPSRNIPSV